MGTAAIIAILQAVAPGILAGGLGSVLGVLQTPIAKEILDMGKKMAKGEHLSDEEKAWAKDYHDTSHLTASGANYYSIHGRWH
jgi:hypothetical protein